jgi:hypothetical protein
MPIPDAITAEHIRLALEALDRGEHHPFGEPTGYELHYNSRRYAPKAVVGLAARFATGKALSPADFSSGTNRSQAVGFLRSLGFTVLEKGAETAQPTAVVRKRGPAPSSTRAGTSAAIVPRNLLMYWKPETAEHHRSPVLKYVAGEQLNRVSAGDTVWVVTVRAGGLFLIGRLRVGALTDQQGAARRLGTTDLWEASRYALTETPEPLQNLDITAISGLLRFRGRSDRLQVKDGCVNPQQLQTMRILTPESVRLLAEEWEAGLGGRSSSERPTGQGYLRERQVRRAVELRAVNAATAHYSAAGYAVEDTSADRPYDLCCRKNEEEARVEVKGSQGEGVEVFLTAGEVKHARHSGVRTDLFVWGHVEVLDEETGPRGVGGQLVAHLRDWKPADVDLVPTQYRYHVPRLTGPGEGLSAV